MNRDLTSVTKLHWAAQSGDVQEIAQLVEAGANINSQDDCGNTPLKYASAEPHPIAIRLLLESGADVNLADKRGFTPLHCAAGHGFYNEAIEILSLLLKHGANVNARSQHHGFVPLHEARGAKIIDMLLAHGADPFIRNDAGLTPLEHMIAHENFDEAEHLKARIATLVQDDDV